MRAVLVCFKVVDRAPGRSGEYAVAGAVRGLERDRIAGTVCGAGMGVSAVLGALGGRTAETAR